MKRVTSGKRACLAVGTALFVLRDCCDEIDGD